jgi:uncharacterized protein YecT (DUF1311 family)
MYSFVFIARLAGVGSALLIATNIPAAAQDRNVARCLSITDVNERIDCLESGGVSPSPSTGPTPNVRLSQQPHAAPSFDCRGANSSIDRAICADATLSQWDSRMGQQYQQALRTRKDGDVQSIMESQRAWILQRNNNCGGVADTAVWACLLEMTKQRVAVLSKVIANVAEVAPTAQPPFPVQAARANQATPVLNTPSTSTSSPATSAASKSDAPSHPVSDDSSSFFIVLTVLIAAASAIAIFGNISSRRRLAAENQRLEDERRQRLAEERQRLVTKYGESAANLILAHQVWQGMTDEQLIDSWGIPDDKDTEIKRATKKETWKYGQTGKNRFSDRVFLENGIVIGWKN